MYCTSIAKVSRNECLACVVIVFISRNLCIYNGNVYIVSQKSKTPTINMT